MPNYSDVFKIKCSSDWTAIQNGFKPLSIFIFFLISRSVVEICSKSVVMKFNLPIRRLTKKSLFKIETLKSELYSMKVLCHSEKLKMFKKLNLKAV